MNNRRVKLTVPLDIVENITGSARARGAKRPTQPLRGAGLHNVASSAAAANDGAKSGVIASPMPAVVTRINVSEGQQVAKGDLLVVLESMKMENYVYAPAAGEVKKIFVEPADGVEAGDTLVTLDVNAGKAKAVAAAPGSLPRRLRRQLPRQKEPIRPPTPRRRVAMTDIMDSQAVKAAAAASATNAASLRPTSRCAPLWSRPPNWPAPPKSAPATSSTPKGKKTAREHLDLLFDTGTFEEIGRFQGGNIAGGNAGAAVITGFGQVYGRKVAVYAQDFSVKGGTLGTAEGEKICRLMDMAIDLKVPIVAIVDSGGARIQEGVAALTQYGRIFRKTCEASGFVPQLSLILGPCAGGAVYCPALTDLIIMTRENSNMFVTGPDVVKASTGETISMADLGGGEVHNRVSGVAHYLGEDESDAIDYARTVLAYLPSNSESKPPVYAYAVTRAERETAKRLATIRAHQRTSALRHARSDSLHRRLRRIRAGAGTVRRLRARRLRLHRRQAGWHRGEPAERARRHPGRRLVRESRPIRTSV